MQQIKGKRNSLRRIVAWIVGVIFAIVIIVPCLLYIPAIQEGVKNIATYYVNKNTSLKMNVGRILLEFPLDLSVEDVLVLDEKGDTIAYAGKAVADVRIGSLLKLKIDIRSVELEDVVYNMESADSALSLAARIDKFRLADSDVRLKDSEINLGAAHLNGGKVRMLMGPSKADTVPVDTAAMIDWLVKIGKFQLDNVDFNMQMLPVIQNLDARIGQAALNGGVIDLGSRNVGIKYIGVDRADVDYKYPVPNDSLDIVTPVDSTTLETPTDTLLWTVKAEALRLNNSHAVYAMAGAEPVEGLDMNYMELSDINIAIDRLYNRGTDIKLTLSQLTALERCGILLTSGSGTLSMNKDEIRADDIRLETMQSRILLDGAVGADFSADTEIPMDMDLSASVGVGEIGRMYPALWPMLKNVPQYNPMKMVVQIEGSSKKLDLKKALLELPEYIAIKADGSVSNVMNVESLAANVDFAGDFKNMNFVKPIMLSDTAMYKQLDIPSMTLGGHVAYAPNNADASMALRMDNGDFVMQGVWDGRAKVYSAEIELDSFPLQAIMPMSGLKDITVKAQAKGSGYDIYDLNTKLDASIILDRLTYDNKLYSDVRAIAQLENGYMSLDVGSKNSNCAMDMTLSCMLNKDYYEFGVDGVVSNLDLKAMSLSETVSKGKGKIAAYGTIDLENDAYEADLNLKDFDWVLPDARYSTPAVVVSVASSRDSMSVYAYEEDLFVNFNTPVSLDTLMARVSKCQEIIDYEVNNKYLDVDTLQQTLPPMVCELRIGRNNLVQQALKSYGIKMKNMSMDLVNDSTIYMKGRAQRLEAFNMKIDTLDMLVSQRNKYLSYNVHAGSRPGTNDEFANVTLKGGVRGNALGMLLEQQNIRGEMGFRMGLNAFLGDTAVNVNFFPKEPIIGYRKWNVNEGNLIAFNYIDKHFDANLSLKSDSSFVSLRTKHDHSNHGQEDVIFSMGGVQISEWLRVSPFMPPMSGMLSSDVKLKFDGEHVWGGGIARMKDFKYNRKMVGDFDFKVGMELDPVKNYIRLKSAFDVDGRRAIFAEGALNDTTSKNPFRLTLGLDSFPLRIANPFIPGDMAKLGGTLNGNMNVVGSLTEPIMNGYVQCSDAEISMPLFGSRLTLSSDRIPVDSSLVRFDGFKIQGSNKNAINVNGYVNMLPMDNPKVDLKLSGRNVEFVNSKQQRKMEVFGKGYANVDATVKGSMNDMNVDASLTLLPATNLTYVMSTDVSTIATQTDENMVKFVSFADTAEMEADTIAARATTSSYALNAKLNIQQGSKLNVYLSPNGNDRVVIEGSGVLNYSQTSLGDMRLVGQYTLENGFVKYTPPLLSEKLFDFTSGSYVAWTGDVMNPVLNIKAVDTMKASVSQEGQDSRLINFLVSLNITNTLSNMNLEFDLSTNEDVTVQNELLSMSPSQRSSQAINMLLYGTYTGMGTTANTSGNPLYSFLNSQINRWAANTIKGVDLTFGVNQYGKGEDAAKSTSYSYKISKSLFNDRFKIVVGGSYNPGGDTDDNFANSLLNDISFVYMLNQSGSMSVKLFRHTGYESILEGEVTETGGAFVMKRKISSLKNFFRFGRRKRGEYQNKNVKQDTVIKLEEAPVLNKDINKK